MFVEDILHYPIPLELWKLKELNISPTLSTPKIEKLQLIAQLLKLNVVEVANYDTFEYLEWFYKIYLKQTQILTPIKEEDESLLEKFQYLKQEIMLLED